MPASRVGYVYDEGLADYIPFTGPPASLPSGMLTMTAADTAPSGWLLCNGSAISRTTYADLFTAIGTTYGVGDGSTTFNIPDLRGRVPAGTDSGNASFNALGVTGGQAAVTLTSAQSGLPAHSHGASSSNDDTDHSHSGSTGNVSAWHTHSWNFTETADSTGDGAARYDSSSSGSQGTQTYTTGNPSSNHTHAFSTGGRSAYHQHSITVNNSTAANASESHDNLQPYIVLNYIIKY
jgi:microcystin-dependent protein